MEELSANRLRKNKRLLGALKEDHRWSTHLLQACLDDAEKGRIEIPNFARDVDLSDVTLSPRFAVTQGLREDGKPKVRPVDDFTRSGCNAATATTEKLTYESLDLLLAVLRRLHSGTGDTLELWKADIDSAFRRIPILPEHRKLAFIAFRHDTDEIVAKHLCMPFGSVASVHHWERVGDLIKAVARRVLHLPVIRFVDDFFTADFQGCAGHAKNIFSRLVTCMLGDDAIARHKLLHGNPLPVLGIVVQTNLAGVVFYPDPEKVTKWTEQIEVALRSKKLYSGEASSLAGTRRFAFASAFSSCHTLTHVRSFEFCFPAHIQENWESAADTHFQTDAQKDRRRR